MDNCPFGFYFIVFVILFVAPIAWPILVMKVMKCKKLRDKTEILHPIAKAWDFVFAQKKPYWVIINLKDGRKIGGVYGPNSFASSFPAEEQIFLEQAWKLNEKGAFLEADPRTRGIIVFGRDMVSIELLAMEGSEQHDEKKSESKPASADE